MKQTILYERLSRDDGEDSTSNSIQNQRHLLEDFAERNNLRPYRHIQDDGFSGTSWSRPGWQEIIDEIEAGHVNTLVVKNLDRMGRDYLRVGLYLEQFREKDVRLIAVNDGIDTSLGEDDFTPFRAIFAEWLAKDISRKTRAVFKSRMEAGYYCNGSIPYGYLHDPDNRQHLIIDEHAATVVRRIFQLVIEGKGVYQIAGILKADKVLIPTAHYEEIGRLEYARSKYSNPFKWRGSAVSKILERREYMGIKILRKTFSDNYKKKKRRATPQDEQIAIEGGIPQIVDEETWNNAQRLRRTVRRPAKDGRPPSPLTGLLICANCGKKLTHNRYFDHQKKKYRDEYMCSSYRRDTQNCSIHYIRSSAVEEIILSVIRNVAQFAMYNEPEFIERVRAASNLRQEAEVKESKKRLNKAKRRSDELNTIIKKLYETFALGRLPEIHYDRMLAEYDTEQSALVQEIANLQEQIDSYTTDSLKADNFLEIVRRYTKFEELTVPMLNEFIDKVDKVVIHEADKSSGKRIQRVDVHLNFIGNIDFDTPLPEKSAEENEKQQKQEIKRIKERERQREYRKRKKEGPNNPAA